MEPDCWPVASWPHGEKPVDTISGAPRGPWELSLRKLLSKKATTTGSQLAKTGRLVGGGFTREEKGANFLIAAEQQSFRSRCQKNLSNISFVAPTHKKIVQILSKKLPPTDERLEFFRTRKALTLFVKAGSVARFTPFIQLSRIQVQATEKIHVPPGNSSYIVQPLLLIVVLSGECEF